MELSLLCYHINPGVGSVTLVPTSLSLFRWEIPICSDHFVEVLPEISSEFKKSKLGRDLVFIPSGFFD